MAKFEHRVRFTLKGGKGQVLSIAAMPGVMFRGESMLATDDSPAAGRCTRIVNILIGDKPQMSYRNSSPLSVNFSLTHYVYQGRLDTCQEELPIQVLVEFLEDCTWCGSITGTAVADDGVRLRLQAMQKEVGLPTLKDNALTVEELIAMANLSEEKKAPPIDQAELFALVYAGCEAEALFRPTGKFFPGIVQGFVNQGSLRGSIVLGTVGRPRAQNESDITWTVDHPLGGWHMCRAEGAVVLHGAYKLCGVFRAGGQYSACSRPLGHAGDHVNVTFVKSSLHFCERWPAAAVEDTKYPALPVDMVKPWDGGGKETVLVTVRLDPSSWVPRVTQRLLQTVCGLPPRCTTRLQREKLRLLELQLQRTLHPKDTLEYKKQHQLPKSMGSETAGERMDRVLEATSSAATVAVLGHSLVKEPSLVELAARLLALAGQVSHEFLSVKQSRELNEEMRKLRAVLG